jgi:peptidoglycan/xylan/chitin deacetylase (PgdA/CDA1 family)
LNTAGIEFGSHTVTHPKLKELGPAAVEEELRRSKETIEDKLGAEAASFSYPFAFPETMRPFVAAIKDTLLQCGYKIGVSTAIGAATAADDRFFLPRLPVNLSDDLRLFRAKLEGGYDWLYNLQRLKKSFDTAVAR